jgi:CheY-like chemotaxis protein
MSGDAMELVKFVCVAHPHAAGRSDSALTIHHGAWAYCDSPADAGHDRVASGGIPLDRPDGRREAGPLTRLGPPPAAAAVPRLAARRDGSRPDRLAVLVIQVTDRPAGQRASDTFSRGGPSARGLLGRPVARRTALKSRIREQHGLPERVLVVEDDPDTRRMLVSAIADEGYEAIPALDGQHALRTALAVEPSAIVLDLMLPGVSGEEFARAYHEQSHLDAPIVVVSAKHDAAAIGKGIGARAVLPKPLDIADFVAQLKATIRASHEGASA